MLTQIEKRLAAIGVDPERLRGVVVTHDSRPHRVVRVEAPPGPGQLFQVAVAFEGHLPEDCLFQQVLRRRALRTAHGSPA